MTRLATPHPDDRADTAADVLLEVERLRVALGDVRPVDGIDLTLRTGETFALLGESGCGKSMTALALMRLLPDGGRITAGSVRFHGEELLSLSEASMRTVRGGRVGMIFQDHNLVPRLSVLKNVLTGRLASMSPWLAMLQVFPERDIEIAMRALARVGLADCTGGNSRPNPESLLSGIAENKEHLRRQGRFLFSACGKGTRRLEDFNQWNGGANFTEGNG